MEMSVRKSFVTFVVCLWACYCVSTSAQLQADYTQDFERLEAGALAPGKDSHTVFRAGCGDRGVRPGLAQ